MPCPTSPRARTRPPRGRNAAIARIGKVPSHGGVGTGSWLIGTRDHLGRRPFDPCRRTAGCYGDTRARQSGRGCFDDGGTGIVAAKLDGCLAVADGDVGRRPATWGREGDAWAGGKFPRP